MVLVGIVVIEYVYILFSHLRFYLWIDYHKMFLFSFISRSCGRLYCYFFSRILKYIIHFISFTSILFLLLAFFLLFTLWVLIFLLDIVILLHITQQRFLIITRKKCSFILINFKTCVVTIWQYATLLVQIQWLTGWICMISFLGILERIDLILWVLW